MIATFSARQVKYAMTTAPRKDACLYVPINGKRYVQTLPDWEVTGTSRAIVEHAKTEVPAIVNKNWGGRTEYEGREYTSVPLSRDWQYFIYDLLLWSTDHTIPVGKIEGSYVKDGNPRTFAVSTPRSMTWYWVNLMEAHRGMTDEGSAEAGNADYVTERNLSANPIMCLARPFINNLLEVEQEWGSELIVRTLDILKPPPPVHEAVNTPGFIHWAVTIGTTRYKEGYVVANFPQAEVVSDGKFYGVPFPVLSMGGKFVIKKRAVRFMKPGQPYSVYYPEA